MVVGCPKCKAKLRVADEKVGPEGSRFKCPKCASVLMVRRPEAKPRDLDRGKVLFAHPDPGVAARVRPLLSESGLQVLEAADGVEAMVKSMKELPLFVVLDVGLPKIHGLEISRRLRSRPETRAAKILLTGTLSDEKKGMESAHRYGADGYISEHRLEDGLMTAINALAGEAPEEEPAPAPQPEEPGEPPETPEPETETPEKGDEEVHRAKRLVRTILSDIALYSGSRVDEAIRSGGFRSVFANELSEGLRHYENRISAEVRGREDFFNKAVDEFIEKRREDLGL